MVTEVYPENPRTVLPTLEVGYDKLNPYFHRAVAQIARRQARGWHRVDGLQPDEMEMVREILKSAQGQRLPVYHYVGQEYLPIGETDPVEERHTRFTVSDPFEGPDGILSLEIDVPVYSQEIEALQQPRLSKKEWAAVGLGGLATYGLMAAGIATENTPLVAAAPLPGGIVSLYVAGRLLGPLNGVRELFGRSPSPTH